MRTLLIGANGQLGQELRQALGDHDLVPLTHAERDVTDPAQVRKRILRAR